MKKINLKKSTLKKIRIILVIALVLLLVKVIFFKNKYLVNSAYCQVDADCELYECTSCGNAQWIDKMHAKTECPNPLKNLAGCACVNNICKREYKK